MLLLLTVLFLLANKTQAQSDTAKMRAMIKAKQYDELIDAYAFKANELSSNEVYYIGLAYYRKEDDLNCQKYMTIAISKDASNANAYFIRGLSLEFLKHYDEALKNIQGAIKLNGEDADYYTTLGDVYMDMNRDGNAFEAYKRATELSDAPGRAYLMLGQLYAEHKQKDEALAAFYQAKDKLDKTSDSYQHVLFNTGMFEYQKGNYDKAEALYKELIQLAPDDYHAYAKLIQVYYAKKEYANAKPLRDTLYTAHKKGLLKDNLKKMFCFDQFTVDGLHVEAYEKFDDLPAELYYKHEFYVTNADEETLYHIQTEGSSIHKELGGPKYLLGMDKGNVHSTFNYGFNDDFDYNELKADVIKIMEGKVKPAASSQPGDK